MRKNIAPQTAQPVPHADGHWLDLETLARVELTSEDAAHPIEAALRPGAPPGWRAADAGRQTIRLVFDVPVRIRRIHLVFEEDSEQRTQEFLLRWSPDNGLSYREIVRQQYTFSPPHTVRETEDYAVELPGLTALELIISPDIGGGDARASLTMLRLA